MLTSAVQLLPRRVYSELLYFDASLLTRSEIHTGSRFPAILHRHLDQHAHAFLNSAKAGLSSLGLGFRIPRKLKANFVHEEPKLLGLKPF